jgi:radical SAM protein with 4Fe4S-binding SPASM domain
LTERGVARHITRDPMGLPPPPELLSETERAALLASKRPVRALPLVAPGKRRLALADESRAIDQQVRPIYAVWEITLRCDLACRHCGSRAAVARPDELSTAECLDLVRQMAELSVREVTIIGGEAYLREDWLEIVRAIRSHGMLATMTSGGRGIDAQRARAAYEAGMQSVSISIDGDERTHDRLRGVQGSHRAALAAIAELRRAGVMVGVNTQINRLSIGTLEQVLETIAPLGIHSWQVQLTVAMGRAADEPEVLLQPYDLLALFPLLDRLKTRCDELGVRLWPGNNIGYFGPYETRLRGSLPRGHLSSCGAGRATLGIEADGTIKGCPSLPSEAWTGGNIRDASLKDIWERGKAMRYTRDRSVDDLWGYCRGCYYADACRAGCTWTAFVLFGKAGNNPYCHHRALEHQRLGKRERVVRVESAPNQPFDYGRFELIVEDATEGASHAAP